MSKEECVKVLDEAFEKIEDIEVTAENTHYTSIVKGGLRDIYKEFRRMQRFYSLGRKLNK